MEYLAQRAKVEYLAVLGIYLYSRFLCMSPMRFAHEMLY